MKIEFKLLGTVQIPQSALNTWRKHRQKKKTNETGGVIAGYRENGVWFLSLPMPPNRKNKAGRTWLRRDRGAAQQFIKRVFRKSSGKLNYLGEWHTHPEPHPSPSSDDIKMFNDLLRTSKLEIDFLVGVIVGNTGELCVWVQTSKGEQEVVQGICLSHEERNSSSITSILQRITKRSL